MDFDAIEMLNDKEIAELYEDNAFLSWCWCIVRYNYGFRMCDPQGGHVYEMCSANMPINYCREMANLIPDQTSCNNWCRSIQTQISPEGYFYLFQFVPYCDCGAAPASDKNEFGGTGYRFTMNTCDITRNP